MSYHRKHCDIYFPVSPQCPEKHKEFKAMYSITNILQGCRSICIMILLFDNIGISLLSFEKKIKYIVTEP